jgi:nucleoside-diphosphate-sugar epimerase
MRVLVVGATGVIGSRLVPQLLARGHEVTGTSRSAAKAPELRAMGAEPVALDVLDAEATRKVVAATGPDAIIYQATALAGVRFGRSLDKAFAPTSRLRTEGTGNLLAAARETGVRRFVAQSFASYRYARVGGLVKTEDDPLDPDPPAMARQANAAMKYLDTTVTEAGGIALRYGGFYGAAKDPMVDMVRKRMFPLIGNGAGITSFIHLDDAAAATVLALEHDGPAIYNIVDDEPAPASEWLPALAQAVGARPPRRIPTWLATLVAGKGMVMISAEGRGASNAKAKRELGWTPRYPSWRQGFSASYPPPP